MHAMAEIDCAFHVTRRRDRLMAEERRRFRRFVKSVMGHDNRAPEGKSELTSSSTNRKSR